MAENFLAGKNETQADTACSVGAHPHLAIEASRRWNDAIMAILEEKGITRDVIVQKIKDGLDATTKARASFNGKFGDERTDADFGERRMMLDLLLKVTNSYPKQELDVTHNAGSVVRLPAKKPIGEGAVVDVEAHIKGD